MSARAFWVLICVFGSSALAGLPEGPLVNPLDVLDEMTPEAAAELMLQHGLLAHTLGPMTVVEGAASIPEPTIPTQDRGRASAVLIGGSISPERPQRAL